MLRILPHICIYLGFCDSWQIATSCCLCWLHQNCVHEAQFSFVKVCNLVDKVKFLEANPNYVHIKPKQQKTHCISSWNLASFGNCGKICSWVYEIWGKYSLCNKNVALSFQNKLIMKILWIVLKFRFLRFHPSVEDLNTAIFESLGFRWSNHIYCQINKFDDYFVNKSSLVEAYLICIMAELLNGFWVLNTPHKYYCNFFGKGIIM